MYLRVYMPVKNLSKMRDISLGLYKKPVFIFVLEFIWRFSAYTRISKNAQSETLLDIERNQLRI